MGNYFSSNETVERTLNWKRDEDDGRDLIRTFRTPNSHQAIKSIDLRDNMPPVYDQGAIGSCTANAICGAYEYDQIKQGEDHPFIPSRLFVYYNERNMEGTIKTDSGAMIRDGIKTVNRVGVCPEPMWPYDVTKFADKPSEECYDEAKKHHSLSYKRVHQTKEQIKQCLIDGFPIVFGFEVFESFMSDQVKETGVMSMPNPEDGDKVVGGHAVVIVGLNDERDAFLIRNSWGINWGINGYFWMPCEFLLDSDYCSDFWTIESVVDD